MPGSIRFGCQPPVRTSRALAGNPDYERPRPRMPPKLFGTRGIFLRHLRRGSVAATDIGGAVAGSVPFIRSPTGSRASTCPPTRDPQPTRNIPDVAMAADGVGVTHLSGLCSVSGGTSAAAPLWVGPPHWSTSKGAANSQPAVGFLNPGSLLIGTSASDTLCFHDITTCNNTNSGSH